MTRAKEVPEAVLAARREGYSVVPATMDKRPRVEWKHWQENRQTDEEFDALGHGSVWGVVTGAEYGITVLDFDFDHGGEESLNALGFEPHVRTPGGAHVYVVHPGYKVKNSARKFPQYPGLDVRGDGGLAWFAGRSKKGTYEPVLWPPFPETLPKALAEELFPEPVETKAADLGEWDGEGAGTDEAVRFIRRAAQDIRDAEPGTSNATLNKHAFAVGGLVAAGQVAEDYAYHTLLDAALDRGAGDPETVIASAMEAGAEAPWKFTPEEDEWIPSVAYKVFKRAVLADPEPFPVDALPGGLDDLVRQGAKAISCPPDYIGTGLLPALGVAIGGDTDLRIAGTWKESSLIYATLAGPPGSRKTPAIDLVMAPVWEAEGRLEEEARMILEEADPDGWAEKDPPQIVVDDATIEALFGVLERNPRGVILASDELTGWVNGMNQYKGGLGRDRQHWLSIWSRRPIKVNRVKGKSRSIRRPFVAVLGGIQPEPLEDLMHGRDDGLLPRLLMAQGEFVTPRLTRDAMDPEILRRYSDLWNAVRDATMVGRTVEFTPAGYERFETWANEHYKTLRKVPPELAGAWAKMDGQAGRIALVLSQVEGTDVTPDIVDRAVALVRYYQGQATVLLSGVESGSAWEKKYASRIKAVARFIDENPGVSRAEIMAFGPEWALDPRNLDRVLEALEEMGVWHEP